MSSPGFEGAAPLGRSTALLIKLRLRRLHNQLRAASQRRKKRDAAPATGREPATRKGNPGKQGSNVVLYVFLPLMMLVFGSMARSAVLNLHEALDRGGFWHTVEFAAPFVVGLAFLLLVMWLASLLLTIASGELAKADWDLEWLVTLPIRADTLLWARILERSVVNPSGFMAVLPACTVVAWYSGHHWLAPVMGLLATWPLLLLAAVVRTLLDTGLRLRMSAAQLRNLSAVISVLAIVSMYLAMSLGIPGKSTFMLGVAATMPAWLTWTPMGIAVLALNERDGLHALVLWALLAAQSLALAWLGIQWLHHLLRHGVVAGGGRDAVRSARPIAPIGSAAASPAAATGYGSRLGAVQRRELTLLSRDRNFMVQCLVVPLLIVSGQLLLGSSGVATTMWREPNVLASVAFGLAAYSLSMSAFQTLNAEGHALWLLYTFPRPIEAVLMDKARLWGVVTLAYPLALFCAGLFLMPHVGWKFATAAVTAFLGIPIYSFIAVALGVFGSNPLEQHQNQKVKPEYVYLYMGLAGLYIYAVVTPNWFQRIVFMVLSLLLAFALWQKARDRLPYLLDADVAPPARVSLSDGLIAAMVFFVVQGIVVAIGGASGATILVAFAIAGAFTYSMMRYVYARTKTQGVPRIVGKGSRPLVGVALGSMAAVLGVAYLFVMQGTPLMEEAQRANNAYAQLGLWVLPLALIAAPVFEEFIFRGLIFNGMQRSFGLWPATLASAALFACLHPPIAMLPVFGLGIATALSYARTGSLLAPMLAHATYNSCVIGAQVLFR
ncbi:MAG TPA: type II CAAX endopeptidase family protein [Steroidobacteraceae bacterium]|nr:type II CAAX endopeptidase family protein [Steroidobacteraceae bacterium]